MRIPPPLITLACIGLNAAIYTLFPERRLDIPGQAVFFALFTFIGLGILLSSVDLFRRNKTTVNPLKPDKASALVTTGLYQFSRNPMYLGMALVLVGFAWMWAHWYAAVPIVIFVAYMTQFQIKPEEAALEQKFGQAFEVYKARVRRWI